MMVEWAHPIAVSKSSFRSISGRRRLDNYYLLPEVRSRNRPDSQLLYTAFDNFYDGVDRKTPISNKMTGHVMFRVAIEFGPWNDTDSNNRSIHQVNTSESFILSSIVWYQNSDPSRCMHWFSSQCWSFWNTRRLSVVHELFFVIVTYFIFSYLQTKRTCVLGQSPSENYQETDISAHSQIQLWGATEWLMHSIVSPISSYKNQLWAGVGAGAGAGCRISIEKHKDLQLRNS